jgi:hypothetical protein
MSQCRPKSGPARGFSKPSKLTETPLPSHNTKQQGKAFGLRAAPVRAARPATRMLCRAEEAKSIAKVWIAVWRAARLQCARFCVRRWRWRDRGISPLSQHHRD